MTWSNPPKFRPSTAKPSKPVTPEQLAASGSEDGHQAAVFCWSAMNYDSYPQLRMMFAIPNGGSRHIAEATKFVGTGTRSGVPDLMLASPKDNGSMSESYHGLFIEMKKEERRKQKDGGVEKNQINWMVELRMNGYYCKICYTWEEARDTLIAYLEGRL